LLGPGFGVGWGHGGNGRKFRVKILILGYGRQRGLVACKLFILYIRLAGFRRNGAPPRYLPMPNFTRGKWQTIKPTFGLTDAF